MKKSGDFSKYRNAQENTGDGASVGPFPLPGNTTGGVSGPITEPPGTAPVIPTGNQNQNQGSNKPFWETGFGQFLLDFSGINQNNNQNGSQNSGSNTLPPNFQSIFNNNNNTNTNTNNNSNSGSDKNKIWGMPSWVVIGGGVVLGGALITGSVFLIRAAIKSKQVNTK